jgi:hypothetical protein
MASRSVARTVVPTADPEPVLLAAATGSTMTPPKDAAEQVRAYP